MPGVAAIVVRGGAKRLTWVETDGDVIDSRCTGILPDQRECGTAIEVGNALVASEADGLAEIGDRTFARGRRWFNRADGLDKTLGASINDLRTSAFAANAGDET
jgi:hypothetical protein